MYATRAISEHKEKSVDPFRVDFFAQFICCPFVLLYFSVEFNYLEIKTGPDF